MKNERPRILRRSGRRVILAAALLMVATIAPSAASAARTPTSHSSADVAWFGDAETAVGKSHLVRTARGAFATFRTTGLMPHEALTLWWVVFNNPAGCTDPCSEDDIFLNGDPAQGLDADGIAAADIVAGYATGTVASRNGKAAMFAFLAERGPVSEIIFGDGPVIKDVAAAEIHLVARSHGPAVRGLVAEQVGSYAGGCEVFLNPPAIPTEVGECADIQFAVHIP